MDWELDAFSRSSPDTKRSTKVGWGVWAARTTRFSVGVEFDRFHDFPREISYRRRVRVWFVLINKELTVVYTVGWGFRINQLENNARDWPIPQRPPYSSSWGTRCPLIFSGGVGPEHEGRKEYHLRRNNLSTRRVLVDRVTYLDADCESIQAIRDIGCGPIFSG